MSFSHSSHSKPITAIYTPHLERKNSFVDIYFEEKKPVRYTKDPKSISSKRGTYGKVLPFVKDNISTTSRSSKPIPDIIAVKELFMDCQRKEEIKNEAEHTNLALGWCAHNLEQYKTIAKDIFLVRLYNQESLKKSLITEAQRQNKPILIKKGNTYRLYGCLLGEWKERKLSLHLTKEQIAILDKLSFKAAAIKNIDDSLIDIIQYGHTFERFFIFQPFIKDKLFNEIIYRDATSFLVDCIKVLIAIIQFHADGHIHGDIKANNVFVGKTAQLIDCGLSAYANTSVTATGSACYLPPEVWHEQFKAHSSQDIFSTGEMFRFMMSLKSNLAFTWDPYIKNRFVKLYQSMSSVDPNKRPTLQFVLTQCKELAAISRYMTESKAIISEELFSSIPNLKTLLEIDSQLSIKKRAALMKALDKKITHHSEPLLNYLKSETPKSVVTSLKDFKKIIMYYPIQKISTLIDKIGADHIMSLVKTKHDLSQLKELIEYEISDLPFVANNLHDFFMGCRVLIKNLHNFGSTLQTKKPLKSRNISASYDENNRCIIQFIKNPLDVHIEKKSEEYKIDSSPNVLEDKKSVEILNAGKLLQDMWIDLKGEIPVFPSIEHRFHQLHYDICYSELSSLPNTETINKKLFYLATLSYFLVNQHSFPFDAEGWDNHLVSSLPTLHDLLDIDLDIHPNCHSDFLKVANASHIKKLIAEYDLKFSNNSDQTISNAFLNHYLLSNKSLHDSIKSFADFESAIKLYPIHARLRLIDKLGITYIKSQLILKKSDLDSILNYIPTASRQSFSANFQFSNSNTTQRSVNVDNRFFSHIAPTNNKTSNNQSEKKHAIYNFK